MNAEYVSIGAGVISLALFEKSEADFLSSLPQGVKRLFFPTLDDKQIEKELLSLHKKHGKREIKTVRRKSK
jgi:hypothetical protein